MLYRRYKYVNTLYAYFDHFTKLLKTMISFNLHASKVCRNSIDKNLLALSSDSAMCS